MPRAWRKAEEGLGRQKFIDATEHALEHALLACLHSHHFLTLRVKIYGLEIADGPPSTSSTTLAQCSQSILVGGSVHNIDLNIAQQQALLTSAADL